MSSIDKLSIRGIRSFSPHAQNVIEFFTPLTIIVGHNGAGKTTIIECLKYATTGDFPPNSKGGAFVNDPKLSRETEVKAQIKLKFRNSKGAQMIVTRSLQSTQKKSKLEQKTLEGLLATVDPFTGDQVSVSSRCAELDAEIPAQLGVSQAVLENVIFCHQEESFWPLSEPSILKKKFDDIFAATRYTKALDTVKAIRKDLTADLKMEQQKLDFLRSDLDKANRLRTAIETMHGKAAEGQGRIDSLSLQIDGVATAMQRLQDDLSALGALQAELERLQHEQAMTEQSRQDLLSSTRLMPDASEEELREILRSHASTARAEENQIATLEKERAAIGHESESLSMALSKANTDLGVLASDREAMHARIGERQRALQAVLDRLGLSFDGDFGGAMASADGVLESTRTKLAQLLEERATKERALSDALQRMSTRVISAEESRKMRRRLLDEHRASMIQVMDALSGHSDRNGDPGELERRLLDEEGALEEAQKALSALCYDDRIQDLHRQKHELESSVARVNAAVSKHGQLLEARTRCELKRGERDRRQEAVARLWAELGLSSMESAERDAEAQWKAAVQALEATTARLNQSKQDLLAAQWKHDTIRKRVEQARADIAEKQARIEAATEGKPLSACIAELQEAVQGTGQAKVVYEGFLRSLQSRHACPACEKRCDAQEEAQLAARFRAQIEAESDLPFLKKRLHALAPLQQDAAECVRLRDAIETSGSELSRLGDELHVLESTIDESSSELAERTLAERKATALRRKVDEFGRLQRDLAGANSELAFLEQKLTPASASNAEQLHAELEGLQGQLRSVQEAIEAAAAESRARQEDIQQAEKRCFATREDLMRLQLRQAEAIRLAKRRAELELVIDRASAELKAMEGELEGLNRDLSQKQLEANAHQADASERVSRLQSTVTDTERAFVTLNSIHQDVMRLAERCCGEKEAHLASHAAALKADIGARQARIAALSAQIASASKQASEVQILERTVLDNIKIRELDQRARDVGARARVLAGRVGAFDRAGCQGQLVRQQVRYSDLVGERSGLLGELRQLQEQLAKATRELDTDYGDVQARHRQQFVRVRSTGLAAEDLDKYGRALDQAIMKYHTIKMEEINKIIQEIWTSTYQGSDIDTIEIRADHDAAVNSGRSYNYRVVMVKGDTELDLRGRSSAGQRVLASLIIRLALAESFGQHCGILALDEPTTNLDHANIESLARALAQIIGTRRAQSNFQLVIITHDEEFVQLLGHHECADYYWRVFKDDQQHSCIERQSIRSNIG